jgi:hypothetical protein
MGASLTFDVLYQQFERHRVNAGSKEVIEGLFPVACMGLGADFLRKC